MKMKGFGRPSISLNMSYPSQPWVSFFGSEALRRQKKFWNSIFLLGIPSPEVTITWPYQIINALFNMGFNPDTKGISKTSVLLIENKRICIMRKLVHEGILVRLSYPLFLALHGSFHWVTEYMQIFYLHVQYPCSYKGFCPWSWQN